jgi:N-methylhydantoinase A
LRYELIRTHLADAHQTTAAALRRVFAEMEAEGTRRLEQALPGPVRIQRALDMRYGEQIFEISVPLEGLDVAVPDLVAQVVERFHRRHEELYTYSLRDQDVVIVNARVSVCGELPRLPKEPALPAGGRRAMARPRARRSVYLGRWRRVPVFDLEGLAPRQVIKGPAIVEATTTTVLLRSGDQAVVTMLGWLDIRVGLPRID